MTPTVSIILPTYNRDTFLPEAFESIRAQTWTDWELIVVDDGSTDNTRELVRELICGWRQSVQYIYQENQGAYGARNTGLHHASGNYIAFYDSDDLWLPHHLADCVRTLEANADVDWAYGACRIVDHATGLEKISNTFYIGRKPRPFMRLRSHIRNDAHIIDDAGASCCQIRDGLYCGLQNSVIRRHLFDSYRFNTALRNEAEDQVIVIWALLKGFRFAYLNNVHVIYRIHESNSSAAATVNSAEKQRRLCEGVIAGFEALRQAVPLGPEEHRALSRRLSEEHFWHLGYATHWMNGERQESLRCFRKGLSHWPWDWRCWKTYLLAVARHMFTTNSNTEAAA